MMNSDFNNFDFFNATVKHIHNILFETVPDTQIFKIFNNFAVWMGSWLNLEC